MKAGPLKTGDVRDDGYIFESYGRNYLGTAYATWLSPERFHRRKLQRTLTTVRRSAAVKGVPFDLSLEYLEEIFPNDGLCPVLGVPLLWGRRLSTWDTSPSLDRRVPSLGYVKGNVFFMSSRANSIKSDATTDEVFRVANYMKAMNCP